MMAKMCQGLMRVFSFSIFVKVVVPVCIQFLLHCSWWRRKGFAVKGLSIFGENRGNEKPFRFERVGLLFCYGFN
jgi:hypothetical protein